MGAINFTDVEINDAIGASKDITEAAGDINNVVAKIKGVTGSTSEINAAVEGAKDITSTSTETNAAINNAKLFANGGGASSLRIGGAAVLGNDTFSLAIGPSAASGTVQEVNSVAVGAFAGEFSQIDQCVVGVKAARTSIGIRGTHFGNFSGETNAATLSCSFGYTAGQTNLGEGALAFGYFSQATGLNGVGVGRSAKGNFDNAASFGFGSQCDGPNQVQLGDAATTTYAYGAVQMRSDEKDKADIVDCHFGLDFILGLSPKSYRLDYRDDYRKADYENEDGKMVTDDTPMSELIHDGTHKRIRYHSGFIAHEVKSLSDSMGLDFGGYQDHSINGGQDVKSLGYSEFIAPLVRAIQEQQAIILELKKDIADLKS